MSAIAGLLHMDKEPVNKDHYKTIMKELERFPANDIQVWSKDHIFLGCHAQWITPESVYEQLPFYENESDLAITADAIIDNREELFEKLQIDRQKRKTITDSSLILLAYRKWEEDCPRYLVGDFAFMIWDGKNQKLFGARDFSGSRTLYYLIKQSKFAFCTTIRPLLSLPYVENELNEEWLAEYLVIAGMVDVADTSITPYKGIKQLPPAHSISIKDGDISLRRYCVLKSVEPLSFKSDHEYIEAFQEVFREAVHSRTRTHKMVGAQLSGGLDSGSIASFASRKLRLENKQLQTFSYIPPDDFVDYTANHIIANETPFIKSTVNYVGNIKDHYLDFKGQSSYSEMDALLDIMEMPYKFYVNSFWLKGIFEKANSLDVGVLLNGGRGNLSISWGHALPYYATLLKKLKWIQMLSEIKKFSINVGSGRKTVLTSVFRIAFPFVDRGQLKTNELLINPDFAKRSNVFEKINEYGLDENGKEYSSDPYEQRKHHFAQLYHWNASNTLATKLSLPYSLWKRDPTNDIRVIQYCLSLPENQYVQNGLDRALIRRGTENYLPDNVRLNMKIRGVQGADWVHRMIPNWNQFESEVDIMCGSKNLLEFVNKDNLMRAYSTLKEGVQPDHAYSRHLKVLMDSLMVYRFLKNFD